ncbi:MAG: hypothetical protein FP824_06135 [Euryarchaeota archaeon]|nr:hypothetical protein [Euryarchaeota archaeon]MBU4032950.1 hypothetical protein [Candidatus Thermoplasmatota archaeon]MBU4144250.1 hypothetical protein [Candidatus Thermoplasmatota archaeon]
MARNNEINSLLSNEFSRIFKRKVSTQFGNQIQHSKMITYQEFRKFCGRSFGFRKHETNEILDTLREHKIIELSSSGFVVRKRSFLKFTN